MALSSRLLPNDHETLGQGTKVPQMQIKKSNFFNLIFGSYGSRAVLEKDGTILKDMISGSSKWTI